MLDELGARRLRLSIYWDEIAPAADHLSFAPVRRWLDPLEARGGRALVTLGLKAQRWPEYYPPAWLMQDHPLPDGADLETEGRVVSHLLLMLERLTAFLADYDAVEAWQVENEPLIAPRNSVRWLISPALLAREIAVVRDADPRRRPVIVNHSTEDRFDRRWWTSLQLADVLAENIYTRKPARRRWPRYVNPHCFGPLAPPLRREARAAAMLGKELWVTELQAEPWESEDVREIASARIASVSPARIEANLRLAHRAGARRVYLWGAEWWRFMAERHGDTRYWELGQRLFQSG